ncbi:DUF4062 domain-containing protein [Klebsiella pneumoniae]|nr:DUF4062 domain-containing protein [Klebsiella pneumoniae]UAA20235.1 DUF4062 domain-containing protein [Klebsiella pneumoniae]HBV3386151.1 DUF4062 domain-containing protein [Klebsiella pneumoniae]
MDDKKYQVFVSSTYVDLIDARKKIIETVLSLYHFPVGMEMFSADDSEQWDIIKETIDASDYYIIIIGHKYGSISSEGISYTEMEYDYAKSLNIPVLAFIRNRDVLTKPNERETDQANVERLDAFIEKAKANKMCDFWESIDDLATKVAIALPKVMRRTPRIGWVRGDQATPKEVSNELAELSTENRKLRERLREYESKLLSEQPLLNLLAFPEEMVLKFSHLPHPQDYIEPFDMADIPAKLDGYISSEDVENYNKKIPSNQKVDEYNRKASMCYYYQNHSMHIKPILENNGKKAATDIFIDINLPGFIIPVEQCDAEEFIDEVPDLNIPIHPIEMAERSLRARNSIASLRDRLSIGGFSFGDSVSLPAYDLPVLRKYMDNMPLLNQSEWVECDGNSILLRAKKLIQSRSLVFDSIILIPIALGEGNIEFKIVCEELKEPIIFKRKVIVELQN